MGERPWDDSGLDVLRDLDRQPRITDIAKNAGNIALESLPAQEGEA